LFILPWLKLLPKRTEGILNGNESSRNAGSRKYSSKEMLSNQPDFNAAHLAARCRSEATSCQAGVVVVELKKLSRLFFSIVGDEPGGLHLIAFYSYDTDFFIQSNTDVLFAITFGTGVTNDIIFENQVVGLAPDTDASSLLLQPIVLDHIILEAVSITRHPFAFISEENSILVIAAHLVIA
jgi:hypothetical protein